jgi:hypothetical protein
LLCCPLIARGNWVDRMAHERLGDSGYLSAFVAAENVREKWDAARHLMAAKQMQSAVGSAEFHEAFHKLGRMSVDGGGIDQLLAIALIVRISDLVKGEIKKESAEVLGEALKRSPEGLWVINEAKRLPLESKPSEIRENIALALTHASGDWVVPYLVEGIAREEKSTRCRTELLRQLAARETRFSIWLEKLSDFPWHELPATERAEGASRLRDLTSALGTLLRDRVSVVSIDEESGPAIAGLMHSLVQVSPRGPRPTKLADAASATIELLDVVIATDFTLIADAAAYSPLGTIWRWWQPSAYPDVVAERLLPLVRKLTSAITLRARLGQKSEDLSLRLRQALGASGSATDVLLGIANKETGLAPEIDDWLRGRERLGSITANAISSLLAQTGSDSVIQTIARLLLDCAESSSATSGGAASKDLRRMCGRIQALASELKLATVGIVGELTEFNPSAHRDIAGGVPSNPQVRIVRPMVVRERADGSQDIVERAIVSQV